MKELLKRLLGIESLKAQVEMLKQELEHVRAENERIQLKVSGLARYEKLELSNTQASKVAEIMAHIKNRSRLEACDIRRA